MTIQLPLPREMRAIGSAATPARVVGLSERQSAIFFDTDETVPTGARIDALCDGRPFQGPVAVTRLGRKQGGTRHVLLIARPAAGICGASVRIEAEGRVLARIDPMALQSPLVDPLALVSGLDDVGGLRLLKLLLTTGASLFGKGDLGGFGALVGQLVESQTSPIPLSAWCAVGRGAGILSWRLPGDLALPALRELCILHDGRARRFTEFQAVDEMAGSERILHVLISRPLPDGADLIVLGEQPMRLAGPGAAATRPIQSWLERRGTPVRARTLDWLDGLAAGDAQVTALRDELACPAGAEPKLGVLYVSETPAGILFLVSVDDPRGLLRGVRLSAAAEVVEISCDRLERHDSHGTVAAGFARISGRSGGGVAIAPVFLSGRIGPEVAASPAAFDGRVPAAFRGLSETVAVPILAQALPAAMRTRPVWRRRVTEFGALPSTPAVALIVAAAGAPEALYATIGALMSEPGRQTAEVVVIHADGPDSGLVQETVASLAAVHRIGIRLVSVAAESFPSERLRAALAEAHAPKALALGPGSLPARAGWLAQWRRRVAGGQAAAVWVAGTGCGGSDCVADAAVGLNAAAIAQLVSGRPLLPDIGPDLRATPGLRHASVRGLSVTVYEAPAGCHLIRAAQRIAECQIAGVAQ